MKKAIIIILVLALIGGGAYAAMALITNSNEPTTTGTNATVVEQENTEDTPEAAANTIIYSENGFSPAEITIESGTELRIINNSSQQLDFASDQHPAHTDNPKLNAGLIGSGEEAIITLDEPGTWGVHDHFDAGKTAQITVE